MVKYRYISIQYKIDINIDIDSSFDQSNVMLDRYGAVPIGFMKSLVVGRSKQTLALKNTGCLKTIHTHYYRMYFITENTYIDIIILTFLENNGFLVVYSYKC